MDLQNPTLNTNHLNTLVPPWPIFQNGHDTTRGQGLTTRDPEETTRDPEDRAWTLVTRRRRRGRSRRAPGNGLGRQPAQAPPRRPRGAPPGSAPEALPPSPAPSAPTPAPRAPYRVQPAPTSAWDRGPPTPGPQAPRPPAAQPDPPPPEPGLADQTVDPPPPELGLADQTVDPLPPEPGLADQTADPLPPELGLADQTGWPTPTFHLGRFAPSRGRRRVLRPLGTARRTTAPQPPRPAAPPMPSLPHCHAPAQTPVREAGALSPSPPPAGPIALAFGGGGESWCCPGFWQRPGTQCQGCGDRVPSRRRPQPREDGALSLPPPPTGLDAPASDSDTPAEGAGAVLLHQDLLDYVAQRWDPQDDSPLVFVAQAAVHPRTPATCGWPEPMPQVDGVAPLVPNPELFQAQYAAVRRRELGLGPDPDAPDVDSLPRLVPRRQTFCGRPIQPHEPVVFFHPAHCLLQCALCLRCAATLDLDRTHLHFSGGLERAWARHQANQRLVPGACPVMPVPLAVDLNTGECASCAPCRPTSANGQLYHAMCDASAPPVDAAAYACVWQAHLVPRERGEALDPDWVCALCLEGADGEEGSDTLTLACCQRQLHTSCAGALRSSTAGRPVCPCCRADCLCPGPTPRPGVQPCTSPDCPVAGSRAHAPPCAGGIDDQQDARTVSPDHPTPMDLAATPGAQSAPAGRSVRVGQHHRWGPGDGAAPHPLLAPATPGAPLSWGGGMASSTWPPAGACDRADGTHSWAYMVLIFDALGYDAFPALPRPEGELRPSDEPGHPHTWTSWVESLAAAFRDMRVTVPTLLPAFDGRLHLPARVQEELLERAASLVASPRVLVNPDDPAEGHIWLPWTQALTVYATDLQCRHSPPPGPPPSALADTSATLALPSPSRPTPPTGSPHRAHVAPGPPRDRTGPHPLLAPAVEDAPLRWGGGMASNTWPPAGACPRPDGAHSWAYMVLIFDALDYEAFPALPRPDGELWPCDQHGHPHTWEAWVRSLATAFRAMQVTLQLLAPMLDDRLHLPARVQRRLLDRAAEISPGPLVLENPQDPPAEQVWVPWTQALAVYVTELQRRHSMDGPAPLTQAVPPSGTSEPATAVGGLGHSPTPPRLPHGLPNPDDDAPLIFVTRATDHPRAPTSCGWPDPMPAVPGLLTRVPNPERIRALSAAAQRRERGQPPDPDAPDPDLLPAFADRPQTFCGHIVLPHEPVAFFHPEECLMQCVMCLACAGTLDLDERSPVLRGRTLDQAWTHFLLTAPEDTPAILGIPLSNILSTGECVSCAPLRPIATSSNDERYHALCEPPTPTASCVDGIPHDRIWQAHLRPAPGSIDPDPDWVCVLCLEGCGTGEEGESDRLVLACCGRRLHASCTARLRASSPGRPLCPCCRADCLCPGHSPRPGTLPCTSPDCPLSLPRPPRGAAGGQPAIPPAPAPGAAPRRARPAAPALAADPRASPRRARAPSPGASHGQRRNSIPTAGSLDRRDLSPTAVNLDRDSGQRRNSTPTAGSLDRRDLPPTATNLDRDSGQQYVSTIRRDRASGQQDFSNDRRDHFSGQQNVPAERANNLNPGQDRRDLSPPPTPADDPTRRQRHPPAPPTENFFVSLACQHPVLLHLSLEVDDAWRWTPAASEPACGRCRRALAPTDPVLYFHPDRCPTQCATCMPCVNRLPRLLADSTAQAWAAHRQALPGPDPPALCLDLPADTPGGCPCCPPNNPALVPPDSDAPVPPLTAAAADTPSPDLPAAPLTPTVVATPGGAPPTQPARRSARRLRRRGRPVSRYDPASHGPGVQCMVEGCHYTHGWGGILNHLRNEHPAVATTLTDEQLERASAARCPHCSNPYLRNSINQHAHWCNTPTALDHHQPCPPATLPAHPATHAPPDERTATRCRDALMAADTTDTPDATPWEWLAALPEEAFLTLQHPTMDKVPRALREAVARCDDVANRALADARPGVSALGFKLHLLLPTLLLASTGRGGAACHRELRRRCLAFHEGAWSTLWETQRKRHFNSNTLGEHAALVRAVRRAEELARQGHLSDAMRVLQQGQLADTTADVLRALGELHPTRDSPLPDMPQTEGIRLQRRVFDSVMRALPRVKAPGPDHRRYEHLRNTWEHGDAEAQFRAFAKVVAGLLPPESRRLFAMSSLLAMLKDPPGSVQVRPIAIGCTMRRAAAKMVLAQQVQPMTSYFVTPSAAQFAVSCTSGAECPPTLARSHVEAHPDHVILTLDCKNAFNSVDRSTILQAVREHFPTTLPFVLQSYGVDAPLLLRLSETWPASTPLPDGWAFVGDGRNTVTLPSSQGVQQGDGLGTFLFACALQPVLEGVARDHPGVDVSAFADDGLMLGPAQEVLTAFRDIRARLAAIGLVVVARKTLLWSPTQLPPVLDYSGLTVIPPNEGVKILGVPLGHPDWCEQQLQDACRSKHQALSRLMLLHDPHVRHLLLRFCAGPWLHYLARSTGPVGVATLAAHDRAVLHCFLETFGGNLGAVPEYTRAVIHLPARCGGQGLDQAAVIAPRALLGSWLACSVLLARLYPSFARDNANVARERPMHQNLLTARRVVLDAANDAAAPCDPTRPPPPGGLRPSEDAERVRALLTPLEENLVAHYPRAQKLMAPVFHHAQWVRALDAASPVQRLLLLAGGTQGAMTWLMAPTHPIVSLASADFRMSVQLAVGLHPAAVPVLPATCQCPQADGSACGALVDPGTDAWLRHTASHGHLANTHLHRPITRVLRAMLLAQGHQVVLGEPIFGVPHTADLRVRNWHGPGISARLEIRTGCEFANSRMSRTDNTPRAVAARLEESARRSHRPLNVVAMGFTAAGCIGSGTRSFLRDCHLLSGGSLGREIDPTWATPSFNVFWMRAIRAAVAAGLCAMLRDCAGHAGVPEPVLSDPTPGQLSDALDRVQLAAALPPERSPVPDIAEVREAMADECCDGCGTVSASHWYAADRSLICASCASLWRLSGSLACGSEQAPCPGLPACTECARQICGRLSGIGVTPI
jgi:hypothetical protein